MQITPSITNFCQITDKFEMSEEERNAITSALLKYCELNTLAMVLIYQHSAENSKTQKNLYGIITWNITLNLTDWPVFNIQGAL